MLALQPLAAHAEGLIANASFAEGLRGWETWLDTTAPNPPVAIDRAVFGGADMAALAMRAETGKRGLLLQTALPRDPAVSRYRLTLWVRCRDLGPDWIIRAALLGARDKNLVAVKRTDSETCYELALPWVALKVKPRPGLAFVFSFIVFDLDSPGEQQASYWLGLTPGIAGGQDPSQYRTFVLTR